MTPQALVSGALEAAFAGGLPGKVGVAISGGGDSVALLLLVAEWARGRGVAVEAVTVDHALRTGSADEARAVGGFCAARSIPHQVARWQGWDGSGNLQAAARAARYRMMADWARDRGIGAVALGHTLDDQAETVLLRLARGSGVDGLSGMAPVRSGQGVRWLRPMLGLRRAALRDVLRSEGVGWAEDPSNEDVRFARVRARAVLAALAPLGIDADGLAATANRLSEARAALVAVTRAAAAEMMRVEAGDVVFTFAAFAAEPRAVRERMFAHALCWVASATYRPRHAALRALLDGVARGQGGTLHGCLVRVGAGTLRVGREPNAVAGLRAPVSALWDNRWCLRGPEADDGVDLGALTVAALGEAGLDRCPDWRATGLPRASVLAAPAVWRGAELVGAPLAGHPNGWAATLAAGVEPLFKMAQSD